MSIVEHSLFLRLNTKCLGRPLTMEKSARARLALEAKLPMY